MSIKQKNLVIKSDLICGLNYKDSIQARYRDIEARFGSLDEIGWSLNLNGIDILIVREATEYKSNTKVRWGIFAPADEDKTKVVNILIDTLGY